MRVSKVELLSGALSTGVLGALAGAAAGTAARVRPVANSAVAAMIVFLIWCMVGPLMISTGCWRGRGGRASDRCHGLCRAVTAAGAGKV